MITATVTVDLSFEESGDYDHRDRVALRHLEALPNGARLVVKVGDRTLLSPSAVAWLAQHARRLVIDINASSPQAVRRWHDAISTGEIG
jgi:hypothetical protein